MIRFALIAASVLGFALTAALGNLMVPMLRELERGPADPDGPQHVPTMGGLCLMVGTLAAVGVGWVAACIAQPQLLGGQDRMMSRLLIGLFGPLAFGGIGLADDLARLRSLTARPLWQAFRVTDAESLAKAEKSPADLVLLDSGAGGTGTTFDWTLLEKFDRPYFLAGGLGPDNAADAVRQLHPYAVDVSSGIETAGKKDPAKMAAFVAAVRKNDQSGKE